MTTTIRHHAKKPQYTRHRDSASWRKYLEKMQVGGKYDDAQAIRARWIFMMIRMLYRAGSQKSIPEMLSDLNTAEAESYVMLSRNGDTKGQIKLGKYRISYYLKWISWEVSHWISTGQIPQHSDHISEDSYVATRRTY